jgi:hypothetical protein
MKQNVFIWLGKSGYNPMAGKTKHGKQIVICDKQAQKLLLNMGLIKPIDKIKTLN